MERLRVAFFDHRIVDNIIRIVEHVRNSDPRTKFPFKADSSRIKFHMEQVFNHSILVEPDKRSISKVLENLATATVKAYLLELDNVKESMASLERNNTNFMTYSKVGNDIDKSLINPQFF